MHPGIGSRRGCDRENSPRRERKRLGGIWRGLSLQHDQCRAADPIPAQDFTTRSAYRGEALAGRETGRIAGF